MKTKQCSPLKACTIAGEQIYNLQYNVRGQVSDLHITGPWWRQHFCTLQGEVGLKGGFTSDRSVKPWQKHRPFQKEKILRESM